MRYCRAHADQAQQQNPAAGLAREVTKWLILTTVAAGISLLVAIPFSREDEILDSQRSLDAKVDLVLQAPDGDSRLVRVALYESLSARYELGWGLLFSNGSSTRIAKSEERGISVDWADAKIHSLTEGTYTIRAPNFRLVGSKLDLEISGQLDMEIGRRNSRPILLFSAPDIPSVWVETLGSLPTEGVVVVVGFTRKSPQNVIPKTKPRF